MEMTEMVKNLPPMLLKRIETYGVTCPDCGNNLYRLNGFAKDTGKKFTGICFECGYKEPTANGEKRIKDGTDITLAALKDTAYSYLTKYSIFGDATVFNHKLSNYSTRTKEEKRAYAYAEKVANGLKKEVLHPILLGGTGRGKTHIALGIMYKYLESSNYNKVYTDSEGNFKNKALKVVFIDLPELIDQLMSGFKRDDVAFRVDDCIKEAKRCDLLILDDLGAERDTDYNMSALEPIIRARENKSMIITTNLQGKEITEKYGRSVGRMKQHGTGCAFSFGKIEDHRG